MRVLDLFSGIGGFSLGLRMAGGFETVQFCEIDPYCQKVLAKNFPGVPIHDDIKTLAYAESFSERGADHQKNAISGGRQARKIPVGGSELSRFHTGTLVTGPIDVICGGFPCQPFSVAGKQAGTADDRDLWPEMARVISAVRPSWVIGENVAGFVNMELDRSLSDLESLGYSVQALVIPACATDARHRRDRVWIVAHAANNRPPDQRKSTKLGGQEIAPAWGYGRIVADSRGSRQSGPGQPIDAQHSAPVDDWQTTQSVDGGRPAEWLPEPGVGRVAHGIPRRVDRLRGLGNAVVPQLVAEIGRAIMKATL